MAPSKYFWLSTFFMAMLPLVVMDIPKHYVDWTREVHDEMISAVQNTYTFSRAQKATVLDNILAANNSLMAQMYLKSFAGIILLFLAIYFWRKYKKQGNAKFWKPAVIAVLIFISTIGLKLYSWTSFSGDNRIALLELNLSDTSLQQIYNANFKGKVVYVDFWGTTCVPCLEEFRNFTKPLKEKYHNRKDIAYLYVCGGNKLIWKQQVKKYDVAGTHIFLNSKEYEALFKQAVTGDKDTTVQMPRYLIIDKTGKIAETNAPRPSDATAIYNKIDKYLSFK
ncbi:TlpA disulfide reductase family protein [Mucilaginibacter sp.]|uniref:TlpA disulfide reductase family protein n=1 Tax=Mucilaginibacter sp. TaxID=1882438 RepID=UPI00326463F0